MSQVIDLAQWRSAKGRDARWSDARWRDASHPLSHPSGVALPLEDPADADLLIPEVRSAIGSGRYCADVIRALPDAVRPGDRVLVIGCGLGILSTLIAKTGAAAKVIVIEPNIALAAYMDRVHEANGVPLVETLNAVPTESGQGRIPLFVRDDVRASSLHPDDGPWRQVMLVPAVDLGLILREERINVVVGESLSLSGGLLACVDGGGVDRVLFGCQSPGLGGRLEPAESFTLPEFTVERSGAALLLAREGSDGASAESEAGLGEGPGRRALSGALS